MRTGDPIPTGRTAERPRGPNQGRPSPTAHLVGLARYARGQRGRRPATVQQGTRHPPQRGPRFPARRRRRHHHRRRGWPAAVDRPPGRAAPARDRAARSRPLPGQPPQRPVGSVRPAGGARVRRAPGHGGPPPGRGGRRTRSAADRVRGRAVLARLVVRRAVPDPPVGHDVPGRHPGSRDRDAGDGQGGRGGSGGAGRGHPCRCAGCAGRGLRGGRAGCLLCARRPRPPLSRRRWPLGPSPHARRSRR